MPSELQNVAQALLDALDEIPRIVPYLHDRARKYREAAGWIAGLSRNPQAQLAATQLDEAARRCEEAAHYLSLAPPKARGWVEQMVSGARTPEGGSPDQSGVDRVRRIAPDTVEGILQRLPVRDESKATPDKTRGLWIDSDGNEEELVSGYDRYSADADEYVTREKLGPPPHSLRIASHVEIKFAMMMRERGLTNETIVINNRPCRRPWGCNVLLPYFLPKGTSLTVYDQDGFGKTYRGRGKP